MWIIYALLSAVTAALVAIFGKLGVKDLDPTLATTLRAMVMTAFLLCVAFTLQKFNGFSLSSMNGKEWLYIILAGVAGALSWLFYFVALKTGTASNVVALDRLSVVFVLLLAAIFLGEALTWQSILGGVFIFAGAILVSLK